MTTLSRADASARVRDQIERENPWYTGSQFAWAAKPQVRRIMARRFAFFEDCVGRTRRRLGRRLRLLDAGCGDGYWLSRLASLPDLELVGVDYNELRVERARRAAPAADVRLADLAALPPVEPFDLVLLSQVVEHVEDDVGLLARMRGLLHPDGRLILGTPNEGSWLQQRWLRAHGMLERTDHVHFYTEPEIARKLAQAGFDVHATLREVAFVGSERAYYWLTSRDWGFRLLERVTRLWPSQCSDYYFECAPREPAP